MSQTNHTFYPGKECLCSHKHSSQEDKVGRRQEAGRGGSDGKLENCFLGPY